MSDRARKTSFIGLRLTDAEAAAIARKATDCGLSKSAYLRRAGLGLPVRALPGAANREAIHQLARIGNNLNQLARHANATRRAKLSRRLAETLRRIEDAIERLS